MVTARLGPALLTVSLPILLGTSSSSAQPSSGVSTPPPPPPPLSAEPRLQARISCPALQQAIQRLVGAQSPVWSVTVTEPGGRLLADLNGSTPRIPASNQKLLSTAFALDRLGPDHRLATRLWRLPNGSLRVIGQGDPDFSLPDLRQLAGVMLASVPSGGRPTAPQVVAADPARSAEVRVELAEEPRRLWWPAGWHPQDRIEAYGAPITRLALDGNALDLAVSNPLVRFERLLARSLNRPGTTLKVVPIDAQDPLPPQSELLLERPSVPLHQLLSLANNESHNFTAEVLLRQASRHWDTREAAVAASRWLAEQGLPMQGVQVVDGSGLDRSNRLTSRFLAALLLFMDHHPHAREYQASMAVAGERGTLRKLFVGTPLQGRFRGKTGTISGVRAISGLLETGQGVRYVSMVSNGAPAPNRMIQSLLLEIQQRRGCGDAATMASLP